MEAGKCSWTLSGGRCLQWKHYGLEVQLYVTLCNFYYLKTATNYSREIKKSKTGIYLFIYIYRGFLFRKAAIEQGRDNAEGRAYTEFLHIKGHVLKSDELTWV